VTRRRVLAFLADVPGHSPPAVTADGAGAFATGRYRNLFAEAGRTEAEIDARIARAWKQLFEGDLETERLFFPSGTNENGPLAYIPDIQHTDVRSEGMSDGMMIAVQPSGRSTSRRVASSATTAASSTR
jgi:oligosaccharide reducing-end xylanase